MKIASLGDLIFEVSEEVIQTLRDMEYSGAATVQTHARHLQKQLAEFTGTEAAKITLSATVSRALGGDPAAMLERLKAYTENGDALRFVLGTKQIGDWRWICKSYKSKVTEYDLRGDPVTAEITVQLVEYAKE